jgi:hypothetical protein
MTVDLTYSEQYSRIGCTPSAPYVENAIPSSGAVENGLPLIGADVLDCDLDLIANTVKFWVNDTLVWSNGASLPGWTGQQTDLATGCRYLFSSTSVLQDGAYTIRLYAEDETGLSVDESWSFFVKADFANEEEARTADSTVGLDLKLNTHDLTLSDDLDLALVAGVAEVAQHLLVGLKLFLGEWYLAEDDGIPYWQHILTNAPNTRVIEGLFRQDILTDQDIESLTSFVLELDRTTRKMDVDFVAVSKIGIIDVNAVFPR